jgi:sucrose-phosphate synthase
MLICNIDETLLGDVESLVELLEKIRQAGSNIGFGVATGRGVESAMSMLRDWDVPAPDLLISGVGTEIRYGRNCSLDQRWQRHIAYRWRPEELREAMAGLRGVTPQPQSEQNPFKISFFIDEKRGPSRREIARHLRKQDLHANVIVAYKHYLDLLPIRASKGLALRYLAMQWGIPPCRLLVAADSGNDAEMLSGNVLGVVVGNHAVELEKLRGQARIYFARGNYARGILEGIEYYDFFGTLRIPATDQNLEEGGAASCSV